MPSLRKKRLVLLAQAVLVLSCVLLSLVLTTAQQRGRLTGTIRNQTKSTMP
ncbi:MAG: hypothetical protein ICV68_12880, partial [Pyrinomonadaceae bacterium]|nr:hypothetical protein [Pyrinomonadaceae bacterium]